MNKRTTIISRRQSYYSPTWIYICVSLSRKIINMCWIFKPKRCHCGAVTLNVLWELLFEMTSLPTKGSKGLVAHAVNWIIFCLFPNKIIAFKLYWTMLKDDIYTSTTVLHLRAIRPIICIYVYHVYVTYRNHVATRISVHNVWIYAATWQTVTTCTSMLKRE